MNPAGIGPGGLPEVVALLTASGLPTADLPGRPVEWLGLRGSRGLEGVVGLEVLGETGLLRSLAVRADRRGSGLGSALVAAAEELASARGVAEVFLLTTTAAPFFGRLGYAPHDRQTAPDAIRGTSEFSGLCPGSAAFMSKAISPAARPR